MQYLTVEGTTGLVVVNGDLETRLDLPSVTHVEVGMYGELDRNRIWNEKVIELATQRGFFEGRKPKDTFRKRAVGDYLVFLTNDDAEREVGRIADSEVPSVMVIKYVRLQQGQDSLSLDVLKNYLSDNCVVRPWREDGLRGTLVRGVEIGLPLDWQLTIKY